MCREPGAYRADGAYGQFVIVDPKRDLLISINEAAYIGRNMSHNELHRLKDMAASLADADGIDEARDVLAKCQALLSDRPGVRFVSISEMMADPKLMLPSSVTPVMYVCEPTVAPPDSAVTVERL